MEQIIKSEMRGMVEAIMRHVEMRQKLHSQFRVALCDIEVYITSHAYVYIPTSMSVMCNFPKHRELQFYFLQNRMHDFALSVETFDLKVMRAEIEDALVKPICAVTANQLDSINQRQKFYPNDPQNITWEDIFNEKVVILPNENHYTSTEIGYGMPDEQKEYYKKMHNRHIEWQRKQTEEAEQYLEGLYRQYSDKLRRGI